jgi:hypothetical protein
MGRLRLFASKGNPLRPTVRTLAIDFAGHSEESIIMDTTQTQTNGGAADTSLAQGGAPPSCCGGPVPSGTRGCCALDAKVKSAGGTGCGCGSVSATPALTKPGCCG